MFKSPDFIPFFTLQYSLIQITTCNVLHWSEQYQCCVIVIFSVFIDLFFCFIMKPLKLMTQQRCSWLIRNSNNVFVKVKAIANIKIMMCWNYTLWYFHEAITLSLGLSLSVSLSACLSISLFDQIWIVKRIINNY